MINNSQTFESKDNVKRVDSSELPGAVPRKRMDSPTIEHNRDFDEIDRRSQTQTDKTLEEATKVRHIVYSFIQSCILLFQSFRKRR